MKKNKKSRYDLKFNKLVFVLLLSIFLSPVQFAQGQSLSPSKSQASIAPAQTQTAVAGKQTQTAIASQQTATIAQSRTAAVETQTAAATRSRTATAVPTRTPPSATPSAVPTATPASPTPTKTPIPTPTSVRQNRCVHGKCMESTETNFPECSKDKPNNFECPETRCYKVPGSNPVQMECRAPKPGEDPKAGRGICGSSGSCYEFGCAVVDKAKGAQCLLGTGGQPCAGPGAACPDLGTKKCNDRGQCDTYGRGEDCARGLFKDYSGHCIEKGGLKQPCSCEQTQPPKDCFYNKESNSYTCELGRDGLRSCTYDESLCNSLPKPDGKRCKKSGIDAYGQPIWACALDGVDGPCGTAGDCYKPRCEQGVDGQSGSCVAAGTGDFCTGTGAGQCYPKPVGSNTPKPQPTFSCDYNGRCVAYGGIRRLPCTSSASGSSSSSYTLECRDAVVKSCYKEGDGFVCKSDRGEGGAILDCTNDPSACEALTTEGKTCRKIKGKFECRAFPGGTGDYCSEKKPCPDVPKPSPKYCATDPKSGGGVCVKNGVGPSECTSNSNCGGFSLSAKSSPNVINLSDAEMKSVAEEMVAGKSNEEIAATLAAIDEFLGKQETLSADDPRSSLSLKKLANPNDPKSAASKSRSDLLRIGSSEAPIKIVIFHDFTCGMCSMAFKENLSLLYGAIDDGRVAMTLLDFPLGMYANAVTLAKSTRCALENGKEAYFDYVKGLYANFSLRDVNERMTKTAKALGLDPISISACALSDKYQEAIVENSKLGTKLKVEGTPTYFINGRLVGGAMEKSAFRDEMNKIFKEFKVALLAQLK